MNKDFENDSFKQSDIPENIKRQSDTNNAYTEANITAENAENKNVGAESVNSFEDINVKTNSGPDVAAETYAENAPSHNTAESNTASGTSQNRVSDGYNNYNAGQKEYVPPRQNIYGSQYSQSSQQYGNPAPDTNPIILGQPSQGYIPPQRKPAKQKKTASRSFVAAAVCLCIIFSAIFGIGGAYVGSRLGKSAGSIFSESGSNVTINYNNDSTSSGMSSGNTVMSVTQKSADTVVEITTETVSTSQYYGQYVTEGAGSGVIIDSSGYIVTCAHVINRATTINVTLRDGTEYSAKLIGADSQTDIAIIKIESDTGLPHATFGNSDNLVVGQDVVAIGNPLGQLGGTVTNGIISALEREVKIDGQSYSLLQTNAAINPGNSGGGLFDADGNLIGIVNAKSSGDNIEGLGFAIPSNVAVEIAQKLIKDGYITGRPKLGFTLIAISDTSDYMKYWQYSKYFTDYGVYIIESESDDFKTGDRIVAIDGTTVSSVADITSLISNYSVGDEVKVTISRIDSQTKKSKIEDINIVLTEKTKDE